MNDKPDQGAARERLRARLLNAMVRSGLVAQPSTLRALRDEIEVRLATVTNDAHDDEGATGGQGA